MFGGRRLQTVNRLVDVLQIARAVGWARRAIGYRRLPILSYHAVGEEPRSSCSLSLSVFERQIEILRRHFRVIPVSDIPQALEEKWQDCATITFDDAFDCIGKFVHPILTQYELPYTIFAPSGFLGCTAGSWAPHEFPVMSAEELRELMKSPLVSVGSHTVNHADLGRVSYDEAVHELTESKKGLESALGCESVELFAFPFGQLDNMPDNMPRIMAESGYSLAVTTRRAATNAVRRIYRLNRIRLEEDDGDEEILAKLYGFRDWYLLKERIGYILRRLSRAPGA